MFTQRFGSRCVVLTAVLIAIGLGGTAQQAHAQCQPQELAKLLASDAAADDWFGVSVSVSGDTAVIGANDDDHAGGTNAGSAYVFDLGCIPDNDDDGVPNAADNCPNTANPDQADADGAGDACDACPGFDDRIDCNSNGVPDGCDIRDGTSRDCNANGVPDECDIAGGTSTARTTGAKATENVIESPARPHERIRRNADRRVGTAHQESSQRSLRLQPSQPTFLRPPSRAPQRTASQRSKRASRRRKRLLRRSRLCVPPSVTLVRHGTYRQRRGAGRAGGQTGRAGFFPTCSPRPDSGVY